MRRCTAIDRDQPLDEGRCQPPSIECISAEMLMIWLDIVHDQEYRRADRRADHGLTILAIGKQNLCPYAGIYVTCGAWRHHLLSIVEKAPVIVQRRVRIMPLQSRIAGFLLVIVAALTMVLTPMVSAQTRPTGELVWAWHVTIAPVVVRSRRSACPDHAV